MSESRRIRYTRIVQVVIVEHVWEQLDDKVDGILQNGLVLDRIHDSWDIVDRTYRDRNVPANAQRASETGESLVIQIDCQRVGTVEIEITLEYKSVHGGQCGIDRGRSRSDRQQVGAISRQVACDDAAGNAGVHRQGAVGDLQHQMHGAVAGQLHHIKIANREGRDPQHLVLDTVCAVVVTPVSTGGSFTALVVMVNVLTVVATGEPVSLKVTSISATPLLLSTVEKSRLPVTGLMVTGSPNPFATSCNEPLTCLVRKLTVCDVTAGGNSSVAPAGPAAMPVAQPTTRWTPIPKAVTLSSSTTTFAPWLNNGASFTGLTVMFRVLFASGKLRPPTLPLSLTETSSGTGPPRMTLLKSSFGIRHTVGQCLERGGQLRQGPAECSRWTCRSENLSGRDTSSRVVFTVKVPVGAGIVRITVHSALRLHSHRSSVISMPFRQR